jgi:hypothetical protein
MFEFDSKRRATVCLEDQYRESEEEEEEEEESELSN